MPQKSLPRLASMVSATIATVSLVACGPLYTLLEPPAPQRSFAPDELLIEQDVMPPIWTDAWGPFLPAGDNLCTTECAATQFGVASREPSILAEHAVYRYRSAGISQRTFEKVYLPQAECPKSASEWTYESPTADQSSFGCYDWAGHAVPICEWAGLYEEYITVFWARMSPDEIPLADIEKAVKEIDARMTQYLDKPYIHLHSPRSQLRLCHRHAVHPPFATVEGQHKTWYNGY